VSIREVRTAATLLDAVKLTTDGFLPLAGGTDLVPRMKHDLADARVVVIRSLPELRGVRATGEALVVGACTSIAELSRSSLSPPWLRQACMQVASPRVRELATIGGALLQERRCRYFNRPAHWRMAAGACLRTGGDRCLAGGDRCYAQQRSLLSTVMLAVNPTVRIARCAGEGDTPLEALYAGEDEAWRLGGIVRSITFPAAGDGAVAVEWIRRRASIDYHDLVVAACRTDNSNEVCIAIGAALPYPRRFTVPLPASPDALLQVAAAIPSVQPGRLGPSYLRHAATVLARRAIARVAS
jgi:CO/xanthine dehydrogenase FAD-binding subunit